MPRNYYTQCERREVRTQVEVDVTQGNDRIDENILSSLEYLMMAAKQLVARCIVHSKLPSLKHMPTVTIVGVGKEERTLIGAWGYLNWKLPFIELP